jgi:DNA primase large subunit
MAAWRPEPSPSLYPFLLAAKETLGRSYPGISTKDLCSPRYAPAVEAGVKRAHCAVRGRSILPSVEVGMEEADKILSFVVAFTLIRATSSHRAYWAFASAESESASYRLRQELRSPGGHRRFVLVCQASGLDMEHVEVRLGSTFFSFLSTLPSVLRVIPASGLTLAQLGLRGGEVYLREGEAIRLARSSIRRLLLQRLAFTEDPRLPNPLLKEVEKLKSHFLSSSSIISPLSPERNPCVRRLLLKLGSGGNLSQFERFAIVTFLLEEGWEVEAIADLFRRSPDYDERITKYQVAHISGTHAARRYRPPGCRKMRAHGLCVEGCRLRQRMEDEEDVRT